MKYYTCAYTAHINIENVRDYIFKTDKHNYMTMLEFNDGNYRDFFEKSGISENVESKRVVAFGEDKALYEINTTGIEKIAAKARIGIKRVWRLNKRQCSKLYRINSYNKKILANAASQVIRHGMTVTPFKKYVYVNRNKKIVIPYRLKIAKDANKPLVIFHGGAGTIGCDNFKTLFEFFHDANGKRVTAAGCNILIPQWTVIEGKNEDECLGIYADNCAELIKTIIDGCDIDKNRIYVYGISHGAMITWKSLLNSPTLYTASVQAMGMVFGYENADFNIIKNIPIWIAHSSDDKAVSIDSDDYCYEKLKNIGADVKYTRWDKYGHKMMSRFYKCEPWLEWLLSKNKQINKEQNSL